MFGWRGIYADLNPVVKSTHQTRFHSPGASPSRALLTRPLPRSTWGLQG